MRDLPSPKQEQKHLQKLKSFPTIALFAEWPESGHSENFWRIPEGFLESCPTSWEHHVHLISEQSKFGLFESIFLFWGLPHVETAEKKETTSSLYN